MHLITKRYDYVYVTNVQDNLDVPSLRMTSASTAHYENESENYTPPSTLRLHFSQFEFHLK